MNIETWPVERPKPYRQNARVITDAAVDKVAASIRQFGFRQPIVVDAGEEIVIGHVRQRAALKLGLKTVPVHVAKDLTVEQIKALRLMDNRSHDEAQWDQGVLAKELLQLAASSADLNVCELTGFEYADLTDAVRRNMKSGKNGAKKKALGGLQFRVIVDCESEHHQAELLERFEQQGLKCKPLIS